MDTEKTITLIDYMNTPPKDGRRRRKWERIRNSILRIVDDKGINKEVTPGLTFKDMPA